VHAEGVSAESRDDTMVITPQRDLNMVTSPELDACLAEAQNDHGQIVLDLSDVDFIDTSALAIIATSSSQGPNKDISWCSFPVVPASDRRARARRPAGCFPALPRRRSLV
jgi:anti-anti-sigma factor